MTQTAIFVNIIKYIKQYTTFLSQGGFILNFSSVYLFTSWEFLLFLGVTILGYFSIPKAIAALGKTKLLCKFPSLQNTQWIWLLLASSVFYVSYYSFLSTKYRYESLAYLFILFLVLSIISVYIAGRVIGKLTKTQKVQAKSNPAEKKAKKKKFDKKKRFVILLCCLVNFGILCFLKYSGFVVENLNSLLNTALTSPEWIIMPLGISFYTFQCIGYVVDVYRGTTKAEKNIFRFTLFISYFPQIFQGPIGRHNELSPQLFEKHNFNQEQAGRGIFRIAWGLFKKLVIADRLINFITPVLTAENDFSAPILLLAVIMNAIWLYADFSGYMDIALGASQIMGINLTDNFRTPFFSLSVAEFWARWHISLGSWFRDYLFYPISLAGCFRRKKTKSRFLQTIMKYLPSTLGYLTVWITMGIWHGASWNFVFEGIFFGAILILSSWLDAPYRYTKQKLHGKIFDFIRMIRTFLLVAVGFLFFSADSLARAMSILSRIFSLSMNGSNSLFVADFNSWQWLIAAFAIVLLLIVEIITEKKGKVCDLLYKSNYVVRSLILLAVLLGIILLGVYGTGEVSFAYFEF